jgi:hypothetical protein
VRGDTLGHASLKETRQSPKPTRADDNGVEAALFGDPIDRRRGIACGLEQLGGDAALREDLLCLEKVLRAAVESRSSVARPSLP